MSKPINPARRTMQLRSIPGTFKTRDDDGPIIEGYFAVFNSRYELWNNAWEEIAPGAFRNTLDGDIRALVNHQTTLVLGRTTVGTLTLREDEHGLYGVIKINESDGDAMNLYARVQRGDVSQCSFGFDIIDEEYREDPVAHTHCWIIREVVLYEVSVVTFPAYEETSVEARRHDMDTIRRRRVELRRKQLKERMKSWH